MGFEPKRTEQYGKRPYDAPPLPYSHFQLGTSRAERIKQSVSSLFPVKGNRVYTGWQRCEEPCVFWLVHIKDDLYCGCNGLLALDRTVFEQGDYAVQARVVCNGLRQYADTDGVLGCVQKEFRLNCSIEMFTVTNGLVIRDWGLR